MPRNGSGTMSVPNTFTPSTIISSTAVNENHSDTATEITNSLPRDGQAGMSGQFKAAAGSESLPGVAFAVDLNTGIRRVGADHLALVTGGNDRLEANASGDISIPGGLAVAGALGVIGGLVIGTASVALTPAHITKLDGIEASADVTDAVNVGSSIHGASAKATPVDADTVPLIDSEASNVLKKVTWANIKSVLLTYLQALFDVRYERKLTSGSITNEATFDLNFSAYAAYSTLRLEIDGFVPATDNVQLQMRIALDGTTFVTTSTYQSAILFTSAALTVFNHVNGSGAAFIPVTSATSGQSVGNDTGEGLSAKFELLATNKAIGPLVKIHSTHFSNGGVLMMTVGSGAQSAKATWAGIRLFFASGNIASGTWALYGVP